MYVRVGKNETIHFLEYGKGKPLVLIPSLWVTSRSYRRLGEELGRFFHVYIPDIFCGASMFASQGKNIKDYTEKLHQFLGMVHIKNYYLLGISFGGYIATRFVMMHILLPQKMFLVSTTVMPQSIDHKWMRLIIGYMKLFLHNFSSLTGLRTNFLWCIDGALNFMRHPRQALYQGRIAVSNYEDLRPEGLPILTMLLFATKDEFLPPSSFVAMKNVRNLEPVPIDRFHGWFFYHEKELAEKICHYFHNKSE